MPPQLSLPTEILIAVVSWLDPACHIDRATLHALVRVSSALWEIAAPVLYSHVSLTPAQLVALLDGNTASPSESSVSVAQPRRTFPWIKTLRLRQPPGPPEVYRLWAAAAAAPHQPLFPAVQTLILDNPPGWEDRLRALNRAERAKIQREVAEVRNRDNVVRSEHTGSDMEDDDDDDEDLWTARSSLDMSCLEGEGGDDDAAFRYPDYTALSTGSVMIFGDVHDVCVRGYHGWWRLNTLPVRSVRNLTMQPRVGYRHIGRPCSGMGDVRPAPYLRHWPAEFHISKLQDQLADEDRGKGQRIVLCVDEHEKYQYDWRSREHVYDEGRRHGCLPTPDTFWQLDFDPEPCAVCGKRWEA